MVQIIATPGSGDGRARATARRLQRALARRGRDARVETFADLTCLKQWAATCAPTFSRLVCVGGDATLSAAAAASVRLSVPLLPVPSGFGNIFARTFGHPQRIDRVIELLDHEDSAVRLASFQALRDMTGQTFDYEYWRAAEGRQESITRWRAWAVEQGYQLGPK